MAATLRGRHPGRQVSCGVCLWQSLQRSGVLPKQRRPGPGPRDVCILATQQTPSPSLSQVSAQTWPLAWLRWALTWNSMCPAPLRYTLIPSPHQGDFGGPSLWRSPLLPQRLFPVAVAASHPLLPGAPGHTTLVCWGSRCLLPCSRLRECSLGLDRVLPVCVSRPAPKGPWERALPHLATAPI